MQNKFDITAHNYDFVFKDSFSLFKRWFNSSSGRGSGDFYFRFNSFCQLLFKVV